MKTIIGAVCASLALMALTPAQAWANPQHERMRRCNAEAKEQTLKGEERKAFMSTCLRGRHEAGAAPAAAGAAPAAAPAAAGVDGVGEVVKAPVAAAAAVAPAAMAVPAAATAAPTTAAPTTAAPTTAAPTTAAPTTVAAAETASAEDKARAKACNRSASEQSLRGAKRKAFVAECLKG
ncbi:MAG: PsiF repeat-containing protein [Thauera sp.]|nr:PsiF repeat-containing protein [Thauera sp.]MBP8216758.1 PsiF repeat-containing protein [Thauera sp.]